MNIAQTEITPTAQRLLSGNTELLETLSCGLPQLPGDYFTPAEKLEAYSGYIVLGTFGRASTEYILLDPQNLSVGTGLLSDAGALRLGGTRTDHVNSTFANFIRSIRTVAALFKEDSFSQLVVKDSNPQEAKRQLRHRLERIERGSTDIRGFWGHYLQYLAHELWAQPDALLTRVAV